MLFAIATYSPVWATCADSARVMEQVVDAATNGRPIPQINARLFSTTANGLDDFGEIVVDSKGIPKLMNNGKLTDIGADDTLRFWAKDQKGVRLERYITGENKGKKAVEGFFSSSQKGKVSASEAEQLGNKFKAMKASDQAALVGGIENKLRRGEQITEAEFLIAVKGQTGWRTGSGLLKTHLSDLQEAYRSSDINQGLNKILASWKGSNSVETKSRVSRVASLLTDNHRNRPLPVPVQNTAIAKATPTELVVPKPLEGTLMPKETGLTTTTPRVKIESPVIEGNFRVVDDGVISVNPKLITGSNPLRLTQTTSPKLPDINDILRPRSGLPPGLKPLKPFEGPPAPKGPVLRSTASNPPKVSTAPTRSASAGTAVTPTLDATNDEPPTVDVADVPPEPSVIPEPDVPPVPLVIPEEEGLILEVTKKEVEGALQCSWRIIPEKFKDKTEEEKEAEGKRMAEEITTSSNSFVEWVPSENLKGKGSECKKNDNPCIIVAELLTDKTLVVSYEAHFKLDGNIKASNKTSCTREAATTTGDGTGTGSGTDTAEAKKEEKKDCDKEEFWDEVDCEDTKDGEERGPAAFDPDPWNILGGNTGKKFPLTPPQPLIAPRNQQMYVTPGYY